MGFLDSLKQKRKAASAEKSAYREALTQARLQNAPKIARARAQAEANTEISRGKAKAKQTNKPFAEKIAGVGASMGAMGDMILGPPPKGSKSKKRRDPFEDFY